MATDKSKKAAESEQDQSALKDESKDVQTTKQADAAADAVPSGAEKREVSDEDVKADEVGTRTGLSVDGENSAFEDDADLSAEDFVDGHLDGAAGVVIERDVEGNEYEAPYALLTGADVSPRTSDSDDPAKSWTSQEGSGEREDEDGNALDPVALVPVDGTPGQTFRARELPDRKVVEAAGIDYAQFVAGLPVRVDVPDEAPRRGIPA